MWPITAWHRTARPTTSAIDCWLSPSSPVRPEVETPPRGASSSWPRPQPARRQVSLHRMSQVRRGALFLVSTFGQSSFDFAGLGRDPYSSGALVFDCSALLLLCWLRGGAGLALALGLVVCLPRKGPLCSPWPWVSRPSVRRPGRRDWLAQAVVVVDALLTLDQAEGPGVSHREAPERALEHCSWLAVIYTSAA